MSKLSKELYMALSPEGKQLVDSAYKIPFGFEMMLETSWAKETMNEMLSESKEELEEVIGLKVTDEQFADIRRRLIKRVNQNQDDLTSFE